jgi:hypothetical protein
LTPDALLDDALPDKALTDSLARLQPDDAYPSGKGTPS